MLPSRLACLLLLSLYVAKSSVLLIYFLYLLNLSNSLPLYSYTLLLLQLPFFLFSIPPPLSTLIIHLIYSLLHLLALSLQSLQLPSTLYSYHLLLLLLFSFFSNISFPLFHSSFIFHPLCSTFLLYLIHLSTLPPLFSHIIYSLYIHLFPSSLRYLSPSSTIFPHLPSSLLHPPLFHLYKSPLFLRLFIFIRTASPLPLPHPS